MIPDSAHIARVSVADSKLCLLIFLSELASLSQGDALRSGPKKAPQAPSHCCKANPQLFYFICSEFLPAPERNYCDHVTETGTV